VKGAAWNHPTGPRSNLDGRMNQPVTMVTQGDALAYAHWLGRDLPTEAEWEYAGKAGHEGADLDTAPCDEHGKPSANYWQGVFPVLNTDEDGHVGLAPVGCYAANDFRLYDMIGNAWEWTKDVYSGPHQSHTNGDTAAVAPLSRRHDPPMVIKGGSFLCSPDYCVRYRAASREQQEADLPAAHIGFRTLAELFRHRDLFIGCIAIGRMPRKRSGERLRVGQYESVLDAADVAAFDTPADTLLHRAGDTFSITAQGYDYPSLSLSLSMNHRISR
jgi:formylglycine-generating enzyme required for sulfatase activity